MKEYYKKLLAESKHPKHRKYYLKMLKKLEAPKNKNNQKGKWRRIYVRSLNKTFRSGRKASLALGKDKAYVWKVMNNILPNTYNIEYISE